MGFNCVHASIPLRQGRNLARALVRETLCLPASCAYQAALDRGNRGGDFLNWERSVGTPCNEVKTTEHLAFAAISTKRSAQICRVRERDRSRTTAVSIRGIFDLAFAVTDQRRLSRCMRKHISARSEEIRDPLPFFRWRTLRSRTAYGERMRRPRQVWRNRRAAESVNRS